MQCQEPRKWFHLCTSHMHWEGCRHTGGGMLCCPEAEEAGGPMCFAFPRLSMLWRLLMGWAGGRLFPKVPKKRPPPAPPFITKQ